MTPTTTRPALACTTPTPEGLILPCPACGNEGAAFTINLYCIDAGEAFTCVECDATFSFAFLRRLVNVWARVLPRVAAMATALAGDLEPIGEDGMPAAE
jgi:hypothetical protein